ncbi:MAG TPA: hypothetical protein VGA77_00980 [Propylenella sp.]
MTGLVVPALVYVLASFAIAYPWHLKVFAARYRALEMYRDEVLPQLGLSSMVIQGVCFAMIYRALFEPMQGGWLIRAATYGAFGAVLSWSFTTLAAAAKNRMTSIRDFVTLETTFTVVQWIVVAAVTVTLA